MGFIDHYNQNLGKNIRVMSDILPIFVFTINQKTQKEKKDKDNNENPSPSNNNS